MDAKVTWFINISLLVLACGHNKPSEPVPFAGITQKASLYCELSKQEYLDNKYVVDECDGAGFTSLYSISCPTSEVELSVFNGSNGEMFRNPNHDCYPSRSKAGFSKDHVLMRLVAAVGQGDKEWPKTFLNYAESNNGFFCDAIDTETRLSRCFLSPFLYEYLNKVAGNRSLQENSSDAWFEKSGFEAHLHVLGIWVKGKVDGSITNVDLDYLKTYAKREPLNALYQAIAYRYGIVSKEAVNAAFSNNHWPDNSLPNNHDNHCSDYLFQRDMSSTGDWQPCPTDSFVAHSGTDYSFAAYILTK